jgi:hypothetical protein
VFTVLTPPLHQYQLPIGFAVLAADDHSADALLFVPEAVIDGERPADAGLVMATRPLADRQPKIVPLGTPALTRVCRCGSEGT